MGLILWSDSPPPPKVKQSVKQKKPRLRCAQRITKSIERELLQEAANHGTIMKEQKSKRTKEMLDKERAGDTNWQSTMMQATASQENVACQHKQREATTEHLHTREETL